MDRNQPTDNQQEIGYATTINDYLVWVNGLPSVKINEIIQTEESAKGLVTAIKDELVEILMLDEVRIKPHQTFFRTDKQLAIYPGSHLLGRTINPLGQPIDGRGTLSQTGQAMEIFERPASIKARQTITRQFETGIALVDTLIPIAFGQRELIIGDPHSGKTGFILDTIINQKGNKTSPAGGQVVCVYALIGKPINEISNLVAILKTNKALEYTVVIAAASSERAPLIFLTPAVATTIAQYFQKRGFDVLLILDDLGQHAKFYREISLLSGKPPGRQSYPGDIFYQHAKLIERAGNFRPQFGGGSITALPVIETSIDDFGSFMTTNLMGMTDGHLLFSASRYHQGYRPSIDIALSVSRVGKQTQSLAQKSLADKIKAISTEAARLESFSRLGSDISLQTRAILKQASQIEAILKQTPLTKIPILCQIILLGLTFTPFFAQKEIDFVSNNKQVILDYLLKKDLTSYQKQVLVMKDDKQFIASLSKLIPELMKICK